MGIEMIFILGIALLLFGPKKLPEISRTIGKFMAEFRRASYEFKAQIEDEVRNLELQAEKDRQPKAAEPPRQIMPPSVGQTYGMRGQSAPERDASFDSAASQDGAQSAAGKQPENAEAVGGPNA